LGEITNQNNMSEEIELLPCPFCGSKPRIEKIGNDKTRSISIVIKCPQCRIQRKDSALRFNWSWLEKTAIDNWNRRSTT